MGPEGAIPHFRQQLAILTAVRARFESSLFDIRHLVMADLFDSELDAAETLAKKNFLRGAVLWRRSAGYRLKRGRQDSTSSSSCSSSSRSTALRAVKIVSVCPYPPRPITSSSISTW